MDLKAHAHDELFPIEMRAMFDLRRAGWVIVEHRTIGLDGSAAWLLFGINRRKLIKADGATRAEAWICAVEKARSFNPMDGDIEPR